ncbi:MAG TPA: PQQ-binding-like beta-propeller repeat protein [Tepidisphaeraceae bacterium]|nr:PQQ-binding-like beta-propeller repeat protein [Tepidisphaeraceae bacterium]
MRHLPQHPYIRPAACFIAFVTLAGVCRAADSPMWGGTPARNMVSAEKGLPASAQIEDPGEQDLLDPAAGGKTKNVKWAVRLGSQTYGNPTVAGGRVYVGTNNDNPRDPKHQGDRGVLMCFDEKTGKFLWQLVAPKLAAGRNSDWEFVGLCSSPAVDGNRVFAVTNRCEVICLDAHGLSNGNDGPFKDEAQYLAGPGAPPVEPGPLDADIVWVFDMRDGAGVFPHYAASSSVLVLGDKVWATTSNSRDWTGKHTPAPDAPALVCLDKATGRLLAEERSGVSRGTFTSNWSSPAYGEFNGKGLVIFGGGDGRCYAFDAKPNHVGGRDIAKLDEVWRFDCNPPEYRKGKDGKPAKYGEPKGPSEIIATPVVVNNRVFLPIGQDPEKGDGVGAMNCIDGTKTGDVTQSAKLWQVTDVNRSMSTASVADGLVYLADFAGFVYCFEADTGKQLWKHDTEGRIWGSTLVADGKVYLGNENGLLTVLAAGREAKKLGEIDFAAPIYATPVAANGVLYVATDKHLYALQQR